MSWKTQEKIEKEKKESLILKKTKRFRVIKSRNEGRCKINDYVQNKIEAISRDKQLAKEKKKANLEMKLIQKRRFQQEKQVLEPK